MPSRAGTASSSNSGPVGRGRRRRWTRAAAAAVLAVGCGAALLLVLAHVAPAPDWWTERPSPTTTTTTLLEVRDREGHRLASLRTADEATAPIRLTEVDQHLVRATLAAEDRRFRTHPGIDPLAIARAGAQNLRAGRRVSGGSTLTQQVVKLLRPSEPGPRGWRVKGAEAWEAFVLDAHASKDEILETYLNAAPYGKQLRGVGAAARAYFGHGPGTLTLDQAALLAAMPQSPIRSDPRRDPARARLARDRVLARTRCGREERLIACARPIELAPPPGPARSAPHWIAHVREAWPSAAEVVLPVDPALQREAETALRAALVELGPRGADAGALVLLHNPSGEVRAWVGSADWDDPGHGQFDAALARRQAGSTLKPFAYALAFEEGFRPASLLPDLPIEYPGIDGSFRPRNYAGRYHGPVRARTALANSWNAPAVALASALGPGRLLERMRLAGLRTLDHPPEHYGLGLVLGVGEVTLCDLATAYATLARGGIYAPRIEVLEVRDAAGNRISGPTSLQRAPDQASGENLSRPVFTVEASFLVMTILADPRARARAFGTNGPFDFPFPVALKTGTSSDWRDNWAIACTRDWTLAAWVGQAAGAKMDRVSGTQGAILAVRSLILALDRRFDLSTDPFPSTPPGLEQRPVCALSGERPGPDCPEHVLDWFEQNDRPGDLCRWHRRVRLDLATGLLAGPDTPIDRQRSRLCVVPSPPGDEARGAWGGGAEAEILAAWCADQGWPQVPAEPGSGASRASRNGISFGGSAPEGSGRATKVRILRPASGSIYVLDPSLPRAQQALTLEGHAGNRSLRWSVNGRDLGTTRPGEPLFWKLEAGRFRIRAEALPIGSSGREETGPDAVRDVAQNAPAREESGSVAEDTPHRGRPPAAEVEIMVEPAADAIQIR